MALGGHSNHTRPSRDVSATPSSRRKRQPTRRESSIVEEKRARWTSSVAEKKKGDHRAHLFPTAFSYQRVAVGAAPVVRQLEQGAELLLVLVGTQRPRHFIWKEQKEREVGREERRARRRWRRETRRRVSERRKRLKKKRRSRSGSSGRSRKTRRASFDSKTAPGGSRGCADPNVRGARF